MTGNILVDVEPWAIDVAKDLVTVVKNANYFGKASFSANGVTILVERTVNGILVRFNS